MIITKAELIEELEGFPDYYEVKVNDGNPMMIDKIHCDWQNNTIEIIV